MRPDQQQFAQELLKQGRSISEVARTFNVHPATIYRIRDSQTPDFKLASSTITTKSLWRFSVPLSAVRGA
jgi:transposase-like protein